MTIEEQVRKLESAVGEFTRRITSLPHELFLRKFTDWSPRDVLAHLIGWNRYTITGCEQLKRGEAPFYFIDPGRDFSNINAASVQQYSSEDRQQLLSELEASFLELHNFLLSITLNEWQADYGVRYRGSQVTIKNTIDVLISDYIHHREEIEKWTSNS